MGTWSDSSGTVSITIDTEVDSPSSPDLTVASDTGEETDDDLTSEDNPTFSGTGVPNARVKIIDNAGTDLGSAKVSSTGLWTVAANNNDLADGTHTIYAQQIDDAGNESDLSDSLDITVDTEAPTRMSAPKANQNGEFSGRSDPYTRITLYNYGEVVSSIITESNGDWVFSDNDLPRGESYLSVAATDAAGNEGQLSVETRHDKNGSGPGGGFDWYNVSPPIVDSM